MAERPPGAGPHGGVRAWRRALLLGVLAPVHAALAAPFCVQTQLVPPQCIYYDAASCGKRAAEMNGSCSVNPTERTVTAGFGTYCVIDSTQIAQCNYVSFGSCNQEAARRNAVCIRVSRPAPPGQATDPFALIRP